jgi:hypothetical protein
MRGRIWGINSNRDFRNILLVAVVASLFFCVPEGTQGAPKPVMVHYMPWFVARPYSNSWGWHWTMNHYNPGLVLPADRTLRLAGPGGPGISCPADENGRDRWSHRGLVRDG